MRTVEGVRLERRGPAVSGLTATMPHEEAVLFGCEDHRLLGVLHHPATQAPPELATTGVVVIVGGPQYRAGSHRQFVHLARALAAAGHPVLRFDVRGMGDSTGTLHTFEDITPDVGAAIDALLERESSVRRVVLWGLCDGASAALLYLHDRPDPRVQGLCLLNPWVRSEGSRAKTQVKHYYAQRLVDPNFWRKLISGRVGFGSLREAAQAVARVRQRSAGTSPARRYQDRMADGLAAAAGPVLLVLSGRDLTAMEFIEFTRDEPVWQSQLTLPRLHTERLPDADHTFSGADLRAKVERLTLHWLHTKVCP